MYKINVFVAKSPQEQVIRADDLRACRHLRSPLNSAVGRTRDMSEVTIEPAASAKDADEFDELFWRSIPKGKEEVSQPSGAAD